jgi:Yip1 domain
VSEKPPKPGAIADAKALSGSDEAQAHVRRWWRLVPRLLTHPTEVFVALQDDDEVDVDARSEPILAIVIVAGMAGILLTPAWATLIDEESLDWMVLAVVTFIGGLLYGAAGYFLLGAVMWLGLHAVGLDTRGRKARQLVGFAALPFALSIIVTVPAIVVAFGYDWFRTGGSDDGTGRAVVLAVGLALALWSLGLLALGLRTTLELPWRGVIGALAFVVVIVAAFVMLQSLDSLIQRLPGAG